MKVFLGICLTVCFLFAPSFYLHGEAGDKLEVDRLNHKAEHLVDGSPAESLKAATSASELAGRVGYIKGEALAHRNIGLAYFYQNRYSEAFKPYKDSLRLYEQIGEEIEVALVYLDMGDAHWMLSQYQQALEMYLNSLKKLKPLKHDNSLANVKNKIGLVYEYLGNHKKAMEFYSQSLGLARKTNSHSLISGSLGNMGNLHIKQQNYTAALKCHQEALEIELNLGNLYMISDTRANIGDIYLKQRKYRQALFHYNKALKISQKLKEDNSVANLETSIATVYIKLGKFSKAEKLLKSSLEFAQKTKDKQHQKNLYLLYSEMYERQGRVSTALEYHKLFHNLFSEIYNQESSHRIAELQAQYDAVKREKEMEINRLMLNEEKMKLLQERFFRYALMAGMLLVFVIILLLFRKYLYLFAFWKKSNYIKDFKLIEKIGSGGMGTVYKAEHSRDKNQTVAIKILKESHFNSDESRKRFHHEMAVVSRLRHPNIVDIIGQGQQKEKLYIIMELLEGRTLDSHIKRKEPISLKISLQIMIQIARAIKYIHGERIMHRDLKPLNIFLVEFQGDPYFVKLLDFGLAKTDETTSLTQSGMIVGTLEYVAPEIYSGHPHTYASDIYSLGVIFYELVTGHALYSGGSARETIMQIIDVMPTQPKVFRPEIPRILNNLIFSMISKRPKERPRIAQVQDELKKVLFRVQSDSMQVDSNKIVQPETQPYII